MISPASPTQTADEESGKRLAVLIDADNAQPAVIEALLQEVALYGEAIVRRIYGDFSATASGPWKSILNQHSIKAVQQFAYTTGKNATDITMIIDAMDLLYTRRLDGFCLVSSDSDFTGLAVRLREEGLLVYGFGEQKTPEAFRNACHKFILTEVLRPAKKQPTPAGPSTAVAAATAKSSAATTAAPAIPVEFLKEALNKSEDDDGWSQLGTFGSYLRKIKPDFDPRPYGFKKLSDLVKSYPEIFQTEEREGSGGHQKVLYVRAKGND
jgi:hypothetical protein